MGYYLERYSSQQREGRDAAAGPFYVTVEHHVGYDEGRGPKQQPDRGGPHAATIERLLEEVESQRGDQGAAREGQGRGEQRPWRRPIGPGDGADHQGARGHQPEEEGVQHLAGIPAGEPAAFSVGGEMII